MTVFSCFLVGNEPLTVECGKQLLAAGHKIAQVATSDAAVAAWDAVQARASETAMSAWLGQDLPSKFSK